MNFIEIAQITNLLVGEPIRSLFPEGGHRAAPGPGDGPETFILSGREMSAVRAAYTAEDPHTCEAVRRLLGKANQDLAKPLGSVTQKTAGAPSGDVHDYYSAAKYYWPIEDARARKGVKKHERRDGLVNPAVYSSDYDFLPLVRSADAALTLAIAGFITGDPVYRNRAAELLRAWFLDPATRQNPNFQFAQAIPGDKTGQWQGLIEARNFLYFIDASQLLRGTSAWSQDDHKALKLWFKEFFAWLRTSDLGKRARKSDNNIAMWYDLQAVVYALFTGQRKLAETIMRNSVEPRMAEQIAPNGSLPAEMARARPYDYVVFNLLAMLDLAHVAERMDIDLWTLEAKDGANLENALNWLLSVVPAEQLTERLKREADRQRLRHEVEQLQATVAINQAELDQARTHLAMRERFVEGVREEVKLLRGCVAADQDEIDRLKLEIRTSHGERAELLDRLAEAEKSHADEVAQLRTELAEIEKRLAEAEGGRRLVAKKLEQVKLGLSEVAAGMFELLDRAEVERERALAAQAERIDNQPFYRIGKQVVPGSRSFGGLLRLPISLWRSSRAFRSDRAKITSPADAPVNLVPPMPTLAPSSFLAGREPIFFKADIPPRCRLRISGYAIAKKKDEKQKLTVLARYRDAEGNAIPPTEGSAGRSDLFPDCIMYKVALNRGEPFELSLPARRTGRSLAEVGFLAPSENDNSVFVRLAAADSVAVIEPGPPPSASSASTAPKHSKEPKKPQSKRAKQFDDNGIFVRLATFGPVAVDGAGQLPSASPPAAALARRDGTEVSSNGQPTLITTATGVSPMAALAPTSFSAGKEPVLFTADIPPRHSLRISGYAIAKRNDDTQELIVVARYRDAEGNVIPPTEDDFGRSKVFPDCPVYRVALIPGEPFDISFPYAKQVTQAEVGFLARKKSDAKPRRRADPNGAPSAKRGNLTLTLVGTDPASVPKPDIEALRAEYERKGLHLVPDTFVLFRVVGNDLPPRHCKGQGLENLRFILENEPDLADCEKRWVVNRIVDREMEQQVIALLEEHGKQYIHIPFVDAEYRETDWELEGFPRPGYLYSKDYQDLVTLNRQRVDDHTYHRKNLYIMNNNGARNAALRAGRDIAKWVLPWDGNCFMTQAAWQETMRAVSQQPYLKYFVVPMARALDNGELLKDDFVPEPVEEPQLLFRRDAREEFNEDSRYGRRPKVELFYRLGIPGNWDQWKLDPWERKTWAVLSPEAGQFGYAGWVARLFSGNEELELVSVESFMSRGRTRRDAIKSLIDAVDERLAREVVQRDTLWSLDEACMEQQRDAWRRGEATVKPVFEHLLDSARQALERGPYSVVHKSTVAPSGDPHDYWHPAPYWWPNPDTADGLPYVEKDGQRVPGTQMYGPDSDRYDRTRLQLMFDDTTSLALAWFLTEEGAFAAHGARLVRTWFLEPETRMNPRLTYAQVRVGHRNEEGVGSGIIEMKDLYYFLDAVRLLQRSGAFTEEDHQGLATWLRSYLSWLQESRQGRSEFGRFNNHGTLYDLQVTAIAAYLDDLRTVLDTLKRSKQRIVQQFGPDGRQPFEMDRPITQHYCAFNLQSWVNLASFAQSCGVDLWRYSSSDRRSLRKGFEWTLSHMGQPWPYEQIEPFDEERFLPLFHAYVSAYGERPVVGLEPVPDRWEVKPVFFPHDGVRPYWMIGA